jgi:hypothetical protein
VTGEPFKVENYYFQFVFQRLIQKTTLPLATNTYTFAAFKGILAFTKALRNIKLPDQSMCNEAVRIRILLKERGSIL